MKHLLSLYLHRNKILKEEKLKNWSKRFVETEQLPRAKGGTCGPSINIRLLPIVKVKDRFLNSLSQ
ncbi:hypothetical protein ACQP3J_27315, partial [Escherichia coli]